MMNCMGSGGGATMIGGIRVADWALGLTYGMLLLIGGLLVASSVRALLRGLFARRRRSPLPTGGAS